MFVLPVIEYVSSEFSPSDNEGLQALGRQLSEALKQEGPIKNAMIWSLSQNPAFRKSAAKFLPKADEELSKELGVDVRSPLNEFFEEESPEVEEAGMSREPTASEFLKEKETTTDTGYVPKGSSKSGVTIATGLDLGSFDISVLNLPIELEAKLAQYKGLRGEEARKVADKLVLTEDEVIAIDEAMTTYNDEKTSTLTEGLGEEYNNPEFKEGLDSLFTNTQVGARKLVERVKAGNVDEAIDKGVEHNKTGGKFAAGLLQRRMEELYKMFPEKAELIQEEGKIEYDKYQGQTNRSWDQVNTIEEQVEDAKGAIDRQMRQQSSGDIIPESHIDQTLGALGNLDTSEDNIGALQDEAMKMETNSDADRLKRLLEGLKMS